MEKIKYRDLIMQYLTALEPDQTITTEQVAEYVAERLLLDTAMVKKTVNGRKKNRYTPRPASHFQLVLSLLPPLARN